jgi:hypothetical protein
MGTNKTPYLRSDHREKFKEEKASLISAEYFL